MKRCGRRYDTGQCVEVTVEEGIIKAINPIVDDPELPWISPGWIDLQVNGFAGFDFNSETTTYEDIVGVTRSMFAHGVTSYYPTIITGSFERISQALGAIGEACERDTQVNKVVCGIHLEGPYLSAEDGPRGAHDKVFIHDPDPGEFEAWQQAAGGRITLVTLAPERVNAPKFIRKLAESGIIISIGHTMANTDQLNEAVVAGASMSTHLGNGAHPVLPRHPNYIWDQLAADGLYAMFIADGHHLPVNTLKAMIRAKRDKFILVSDCVKFGGMQPGRYSSAIGAEVDLLANGRLQTVANPLILAGSAQPLDRGVENAIRHAGISIKEAIDAVTIRPATVMGLNSLGKLEVGAAGNLTLFVYEEDKKLQVLETILAGNSVYS